MPAPHQQIVLEYDVFALTAKGHKELDGSETSLSPSELEVLILIDGKSTAAETAARARAVGKGDAFEILARLFLGDLIELVRDKGASLDFVDFFQVAGPAIPSEAATAKASKQTAATTLLLQQKGYTVRIARRAEKIRNAKQTRALSVLVVEDEPHLSDLLKHLLTREGFEVRTAKNRAEIVAQMRSPLPDLVLLDVVLPDADGFEVLLKMRQHPALKAIPVVMLTSQATRDAVLKGLASGADGYITKPFRVEVLVKAVAAVLGLPGHEGEAEDAEDPWSL